MKSRWQQRESEPLRLKLDDLLEMRALATGFSLHPRQPVSSLLSGRHAARIRGRGLMFEELRDYRPGDDIRSIDWKATARKQQTYVRVYTEERERPVLLLVDMRSCMLFGSQRATKAFVAAQLAALAAWRTLAEGDRVGALIFTDTEIHRIRPQRNQRTVLQICHQLIASYEQISVKQPCNNAMLNQVFQQALHQARHDHLILLITDYQGDDAQTRDLAMGLSRHNDVMAVLVYDPLGIELPAHGDLPVYDGVKKSNLPEGEAFRRQFRGAFEQRINDLREHFDMLQIPIMPVCTHEPVLDQVREALGQSR